MLKKLLLLAFILSYFWLILVAFLDSDLYVEIQRWIVEITHLENGTLIIDDLVLTRNLNGAICNEVGLNPKESEGVTNFSAFFDTGMSMAFETAEYDVEGNYQFSIENGMATIDIDEICWSEDNTNLAWIDYYSKQVFPRFTKFVIPIIKLEGEFRVNLDFHQTLEPYRYFGILSARLSEGLYRIPQGFSRKIESVGELVIDLKESDTGNLLRWNRFIGLMLSFSGYGELTFGPPRLVK